MCLLRLPIRGFIWASSLLSSVTVPAVMLGGNIGCGSTDLAAHNTFHNTSSACMAKSACAVFSLWSFKNLLID